MKASSKVFLGVSGALAVVFGVKTAIDYDSYRHSISSVPFLGASVNALLFLLPAAVLTAVVLFGERRTRVLAICAAVFAAAAAVEFARQVKVYRFGVADGMLMSSPYFAAAVIFAVFMTICLVKSGGEKTPSMVLLGLSGLITVGFVIACIFEIIDRQSRDNIMQLFAGFFCYALFLLLPAAILAATALFLRGRTVLLIIGAVMSVLVVMLMLVLRVLWIMTVPALVSAAVCVVFAVKSKKRGKT